jgi:hypothetical protein
MISRMNITKLDAAKSQLATAILLYFEDCDPVSVHTLVMAAGEIIDRLCESKGTPAMREQFFAMIKPERRKEFVRRLNEARNFFKHAQEPNAVLEDFSDEYNLVGIIMAVYGLGLLGVEMLETRIFTAWSWVVNPGLMGTPPEKLFPAFSSLSDLRNQPRAAQKEIGRDVLRLSRLGLPSTWRG